MDRPRDIDRLAYDFADATRSLGSERGTDLLLILLYARWWCAKNAPDAWENIQHRPPSELHGVDLLNLHPDMAASAGTNSAPELMEDGGKAMGFALRAIESLPVAISHEAFEAILDLRLGRLSKASAEHETSRQSAELMVACLPYRPGTVLDPACGIGTCLLHAHRAGAQALHGIEINEWTAAVARMRLQLAGVANAHIQTGDALIDRPWPTVETVLVDPPWGSRLNKDHQARITANHPDIIVPPNSDLVWAQLACRAVCESGRALVLLPAGAGWRRNRERDARAMLVQHGWLEAYIALIRPKRATYSDGALWLMRPALTGVPEDVLIAAVPVELDRAPTEEHEQPDVRTRLEMALRRLRQRDEDLGVPKHVAVRVPIDQLLGEIEPGKLLEPAPIVEPTRPSPPKRLLTELRFSNLKSFGDQQNVVLAPITLIYGQNSAGKSSVLQSLLLLRQSINANTLVTQGRATDAGSFLGLLHRHDPDRELRLGFTFGTVDRWAERDAVPNPGQLRAIDFSFYTPTADLPYQRDIAFGIAGHQIRFGRVGGSSDASTFDLALDGLQDAFIELADNDLLWRRKDAGRAATDTLQRPRGPPRKCPASICAARGHAPLVTVVRSGWADARRDRRIRARDHRHVESRTKRPQRRRCPLLRHPVRAADPRSWQ